MPLLPCLCLMSSSSVPCHCTGAASLIPSAVGWLFPCPSVHWTDPLSPVAALGQLSGTAFLACQEGPLPSLASSRVPWPRLQSQREGA